MARWSRESALRERVAANHVREFMGDYGMKRSRVPFAPFGGKQNNGLQNSKRHRDGNRIGLRETRWIGKTRFPRAERQRAREFRVANRARGTYQTRGSIQSRVATARGKFQRLRNIKQRGSRSMGAVGVLHPQPAAEVLPGLNTATYRMSNPNSSPTARRMAWHVCACAQTRRPLGLRRVGIWARY